MNQTEEKKMKKKIARGRIVRNTTLTVLCLVLGVVIAFEYKSIKAAAGATAANNTLVDYQATIIELSNTVEALKQQKSELEQKVNTLENSTNEERIDSLEAENAALRDMLGLREVTGEGVVITVTYENPGDLSQSGSHLLLLINELKASGAQAIAINGERLHSMSEVRPVSDYLVVNGNAFYAPITISVIGKRTDLMSSLEMSGVLDRFRLFFELMKPDEDAKGGEITVTYHKEVTIPALTEEYLKNVTGNLTNSGG